MDYTQSNAKATHPGTGQPLHQSQTSPTTRWSSNDANSLIWELMEVVKAGGKIDPSIKAEPFDPDVPTSYNAVLRSLRAIADSLVGAQLLLRIDGGDPDPDPTLDSIFSVAAPDVPANNVDGGTL